MFVVTADQINSREQADAVAAAIDDLSGTFAPGLVLPPDRSAGDEVQVLLSDAATTLDVILHLTRTKAWSVGLGIGAVREPLAASIRESTGPAFIAARAAVQRAKAKPTRFAIEREPATPATTDAEAVIDLLLLLRGRRTDEGWAVYDLRTQGLSQAKAADKLGITPQAASDRARAADLRAEFAATDTLQRMLGALDGGRD